MFVEGGNAAVTGMDLSRLPKHCIPVHFEPIADTR